MKRTVMKYLIILQTIIILFIPFQILAQDSSKKITYQKQIKIALSGIVYDHLHLNHEGKKLLKSAPMPSGDISILFYQHIHNGLGAAAIGAAGALYAMIAENVCMGNFKCLYTYYDGETGECI